MTKPLETLCNIMAEVHVRIQQDFQHIDPIMGVNQKMRTIGIASDVMTIDCIKTGKRILLILHDNQPEYLNYQFCFRDKDPADEFDRIQINQLSEKLLYNWIKDYFSNTTDQT